MSKKVNELVEFSAKHPWKPNYPKSQVQRFLTELVSDSNLIFDVHDSKGRVSAAVLLDEVRNPDNDACLEILGMRIDANKEEIISRFIDLAKVRRPNRRSGFQLGFHESCNLDRRLLQKRGLAPHYDTYAMIRSDLKGVEVNSPREISRAGASDRDEVYNVLCEAFKKTPDTSIPDRESWGESFGKSPRSYTFVWREGGRIVGFASMLHEEGDEDMEIRTVGVLPAARRRGIGGHLIRHCLNECAQLGMRTCHLSVGVTNEKALDLYLKAGFKVSERYHCYRMAFK